MEKVIDEINDPRISLVSRIDQANSPIDDLCILDSFWAIQKALDNGVKLRQVFVGETTAYDDFLKKLSTDIKIYRCSDRVIKKIIFNDDFLKKLSTDVKIHRCSDMVIKKIIFNARDEIVALADIPNVYELPKTNLVLMLDNLNAEVNIGSIIRTARAFGIQHIILVGNYKNAFSRGIIRGSVGTAFGIKSCSFATTLEAIQYLKKAGYQLIATSPSGRTILSDIKLQNKPVAIVLGNETTGLSLEAMNQSDQVVKIPMHSQVDSINVGAAAAIFIYIIQQKLTLA